MEDYYATLAEEKLKSVQETGEGASYIFLETSPSLDEPGPDTEMVRRRFADLELGFCNNTPGIPLPNGNFLFHCVIEKNSLFKLLTDENIISGYRGDSFDQLFESRWEHWKYVFKCVGERKGLSGKMEPFYGSLSELVPGDSIKEIVPTGVIQGGPSFSLKPTAEETSRLLPTVNNFDGKKEICPENFYYFLVNDFGVPLGDSSHLDLGFGIQWWPSVNFPADDIILENLISNYSEFAHQTFTGVLLIPKNPETNDKKEKTLEIQEIKKNVRRLRTYLDIKHNANMKILSEVEVGKNENGKYYKQKEIVSQEFYRSWSKHYIINHSLFEDEALITAVSATFGKPTKKNKYLANLHRSIDSLDLARTIGNDIMVSHVLIWAAIEALISPSDENELISSITLSLIGLQNVQIDKMVFWKSCKDSYNTRSKIVHSFDVPDNDKLIENITFAERECSALIKAVIIDAIPSGTTRDELISNLRAKALR